LALVAPGGTETFCLTVARELQRRGHEVVLFADSFGPYAEWAEALGAQIARETDKLPSACDAVLANDAITARLLAARYPDTRLVYCIHGTIFEIQQPPVELGLIHAIIAPSERFEAFARSFAIDVPIVRVRQPIDTDWFVPSEPPRRPPQRALLLSNALNDGPRLDALIETWAGRGIQVVHAGHRDSILDVRSAIAGSDIVVGRGRAVIEGMACGKAVYVFDVGGGDGWVTPETYPPIEADNFAGMATDVPIDRRRLAADLDAYDPDMGWINRELAVTYHSVRSQVQVLIEVLRGPAPQRPDSASTAAALAVTARFAWQMQLRAMAAEQEVSNLRRARDEILTVRRVRVGLALGRIYDLARHRR
jgi:hypothetical protein